MEGIAVFVRLETVANDALHWGAAFICQDGSALSSRFTKGFSQLSQHASWGRGEGPAKSVLPNSKASCSVMLLFTASVLSLAPVMLRRAEGHFLKSCPLLSVHNP
jgi:hypothetical protein